MFFCGLNWVLLALDLAKDCQEQINLFAGIMEFNIFLTLMFSSTVFYLISSYFAFQSYKEFKGIAYDMMVATHEMSLK
jgi:hypothetical protein